MAQFMATFARFYPCSVCAEDFQDIIAKMPPRVESRVGFSLWMCEAHNEVNRRLSKPTLNCHRFVTKWLQEIHAPEEAEAAKDSLSALSASGATAAENSTQSKPKPSTSCGTAFCTLDLFRQNMSKKPPSS